MRKLIVLGMFALALVPAAAGAAEEVKSGTKDGKPYFEASEQITEQAGVLAVEKTKRLVTLKSEDGDTVVVEAGEQVKNFAQIKVGDLVRITYTQKLTVTVQPAGSPEVIEETTTAAARPGEKPAGSITERTEYRATITAIDRKAGTATLKGIEGEEFTVTPLKPENLDKVSVGELVVFTYTQSVAASVEKVTAKKAKK